MDLINLIGQYGPWSWIVGGMVLLAIELVLPGGIIVWLGVAAIAVGLITLVQPFDWPWQWLLFGLLSIGCLVAWLQYSRRNRNLTSDRPFLNQRADGFVGRETVLIEPIQQGIGRIALGDTVWRVSGDDMPEGTPVRIAGHDGALLAVVAVD